MVVKKMKKFKKNNEPTEHLSPSSPPDSVLLDAFPEENAHGKKLAGIRSRNPDW
jgi:hypothetical protein